MISLNFCLFALLLAPCILSVADGKWRPAGGGRWPPVRTYRHARGADPSVTSVFNTIGTTMEKAFGSISDEELSKAVKQVEDDVEAILDDKEVEENAVRQLIQDCSKDIKSVSALSALFDDSLTFEANNLATALTLWKNLAEEAQKLQKSGDEKSLNVALAAIGDTAEAIGHVVKTSVNIMKIQLENDEDDDDDDDDDGKSKRQGPWTVEGNVDSGGNINGGLYYERGGFKGGVTGHYNPMTGSRGVGLGFTYSFGK